MPLDDDVREMLERMAAVPVLSYADQTTAEARAMYLSGPKPPGDPLPRVDDATVPGPAGPIPVRLYASSTEPGLALVVLFHGGGWVLSSVDGHDSLARRLATLTGALVVSVDYRLAPEDPYPAAHDDCWAVTSWLAAEGASIGGDPNRVVVIGDSAGGNLAATVAVRARDEGVQLALQVLLYPCIDTDWTRRSYVDNAEGYFLTAERMQWFWDQYVRPEHRDDPYAVPMRAADLTGVAPALVQTAEFDPLRDEGEAYAERLRDAGVEVTVTRYDGVIHGYASRWDQIGRALVALDEVGAAVRAGVGRSRAH